MSHRTDAVRTLGPQDGERILDLACGTGINFESIIAANANGLLLGLDYSLGVLEQARERLKRKRWVNVVLCLGDAAQLPFADGTFDRVLCTYALKAIPPYGQALDEVRRVLKPHGVFVVIDSKLSGGMTRFLNPLIRWMARGFLYDMGRPLTKEIVRRFQDVQTTEYDFGHTFVTGARKE
jgi:ubiquinone/menaquinone biosynthesis C-methylase UbiE